MNCGFVKDDLSYSWLSSAVAQLNTKFHVPIFWQMTADMEAHSGSTTDDMVAQQDPAMVLQLANHQGSWNVVSLNGGADDTAYVNEMRDFYLSLDIPNKYLPWTVDKDPAKNCVDTEAVWQKLLLVGGSIVVNLNKIVGDARTADPNVRIATVDYPYLLQSDNICENDWYIKVKGQPVLQHGAKIVVDGLDSLYDLVPGSQMAHVDLRTVFGATDPLVDLQLLSVYGYPHPNQSGQQAIATAVATAISSL